MLALAVHGPVYAGGSFLTIGGQSRVNLAAIDPSTGLATSWNPAAKMTPKDLTQVAALVVSGTTVYVAGVFSEMGGQTRNNLAAIDAATGLATNWNPNADGMVRALAVNGSKVYVGGFFANIGGAARGNIAALDATSGLATSWDPEADTTVWSLAVAGNLVLAGGSFSHIGGQSRDYLAALDPTTGLATSWDPSADGTVQVLAVGGTRAYAGGYFTIIGGQVRSNLAALDLSTGLADSWNPQADAAVGALCAYGPTVYAGGIFSNIDGAYRPEFAALSASTEGLQGFTLLMPSDGDSVNTVQPDLFWTAARAASPTDTVRYTVYWSENVDFSTADSVKVGQDTLYAFPPDFLQVHHTYHWKVRSYDKTGLSAWSNPATGFSFYIPQNVTPAMPAVEAENAPDGILISWTVPSDVGAVGFRVYRQTAGSAWVCISPTLPATTGAVKFVDTGALPGIPYSYEVEVLGPTGPAGRWGPVSFERGAVTSLAFRVDPNPGRGVAGLAFALPRAGNVTLRVFDATGREVSRSVWPGLAPGTYLRAWEARGVSGRMLPSGAYWLRLVTPSGVRTARWVEMN